MRKYISGNTQAVVILHEIYGVNAYIRDICAYYLEHGLDVYCPCLIHRKYFSYRNADAAYSHFMNTVGFEVYEDILALIDKLKQKYTRVFIHGTSVGATIAWRCSEKGTADGVICCYGSRIRDYTDIDPKCKTLLIFAAEDSFDVNKTALQLASKSNASVNVMKAHHGFMDSYGVYYDENCCRQAFDLIDAFINNGGD